MEERMPVNDERERVVIKAPIAIAEVVLGVDTVDPLAHATYSLFIADEQILSKGTALLSAHPNR